MAGEKKEKITAKDVIWLMIFVIIGLFLFWLFSVLLFLGVNHIWEST